MTRVLVTNQELEQYAADRKICRYFGEHDGDFYLRVHALFRAENVDSQIAKLQSDLATCMGWNAVKSIAIIALLAARILGI